jgi:hypothetical protein
MTARPSTAFPVFAVGNAKWIDPSVCTADYITQAFAEAAKPTECNTYGGFLPPRVHDKHATDAANIVIDATRSVLRRFEVRNIDLTDHCKGCQTKAKTGYDELNENSNICPGDIGMSLQNLIHEQNLPVPLAQFFIPDAVNKEAAKNLIDRVFDGITCRPMRECADYNRSSHLKEQPYEPARRTNRQVGRRAAPYAADDIKVKTEQ